MKLYLVRHALALAKSAWTGLDSDRPLDAKGHRQVVGLTEWFEPRPIGLVVSSPALRCVETVLPVANHHQVDLVTDRSLLVGADKEARRLVRRLRKQAVRRGRPIVVCTHGEVLPTVLDELGSPDTLTQHAKGSVWTVDLGVESGEGVDGAGASGGAGPTFTYELPDPGDDPVRGGR